MSQSSRLYNEEDDGADALPLESEDRASTNIQSPDFQPKEDAAPMQATPFAGALASYQAPETPQEPAVAVSEPAQASAPQLTGAEAPEVQQALDDYGQPPQPMLAPKRGYEQAWRDTRDQLGREHASQQQGIHKFLRSRGVEMEVLPDGSERVATHEDQAPRWTPARSQPFTDPETGRPMVRERDDHGRMKDVDLFATKGIVHTDADGNRYYMGPGNQPVDLNSPDPVFLQQKQVKELRSALYAQENEASYRAAKLHEEVVAPASELVKQFQSAPAIESNGLDRRSKSMKAVENTIASLMPSRENGSIGEDQSAELDAALEAKAKFHQNNPQYGPALDTLKGANAEVKRLKAQASADRHRRITSILHPDASAAMIAGLPDTMASRGEEPQPGSVDPAEVAHDTALAAAQQGTTQSRALVAVLKRYRANGAQTVGEQPIEEAIRAAQNPPKRVPKVEETESKAPETAGFLSSAGATIRKAMYDTAATGADVAGTLGNLRNPYGDEPAFLRENQPRLDAARKRLNEIATPGGSTLRAVSTAASLATGAVNPMPMSAEEVSLIQRINRLTMNPGWSQAVTNLQQEGADSYDQYNISPEAGNPLAKIGRGAGGFLAIAPTLSVMPLAVAQMAGNAYEAKYAEVEKAAPKGAAPDEVHDQAQQAAMREAVKQAPQLLAYTMGGKLASGLVAKAMPAAGALTKAIAGGTAATAANMAVGAGTRLLEGQPIAPTLEGTTQDVLFGAFHGIDEHHGATELEKHVATALAIRDRGTPTAGQNVDPAQQKLAADFLAKQNPKLVAKVEARMQKVSQTGAGTPSDPGGSPAPPAGSPSPPGTGASEGGANIASSEPAPTSPAGQAKAFSASLKASDEMAPAIEAAGTDNPVATQLRDEQNGHQQALHKAQSEAVAAVSEPVRQRIASILGTDGPANEAHFAGDTDAGFQAAHVGRELRDTYTTPEQQAAIEQVKTNAGEHGPTVEFIAAQHTGMLAAKDLLAIATGRSEVDPERVAQLGRLGLVEPGEDGTSHVTHDALPLLPKGFTGRQLTAHDNYRVKSLHGEKLAGTAAMVRGGQEQLANALHAKAIAAREQTAPQTYRVRVEFTDHKGEAREQIIRGRGQSEEQGMAHAMATAEKRGMKVTHAEVTTPEKEQARKAEAKLKADPLARNKVVYRDVKPEDVQKEFSPEERAAMDQVRAEFQRNRGLFKQFGIEGIQPARAQGEASGIATSEGRLSVDGGKLLEQFANVKSRGGDKSEWIKKALGEEIVHQATIKGLGPEWRAKLEAAWNDPAMSKEMRDEVAAQAAEKYEGFEGLDPHQKAAELVRMIVQGEWKHSITEQVFNIIRDLHAYLTGLKVEHSPLLQEAINQTRAVLTEARRRVVEERRAKRAIQQEPRQSSDHETQSPPPLADQPNLPIDESDANLQSEQSSLDQMSSPEPATPAPGAQAKFEQAAKQGVRADYDGYKGTLERDAEGRAVIVTDDGTKVEIPAEDQRLGNDAVTLRDPVVEVSPDGTVKLNGKPYKFVRSNIGPDGTLESVTIKNDQGREQTVDNPRQAMTIALKMSNAAERKPVEARAKQEREQMSLFAAKAKSAKQKEAERLAKLRETRAGFAAETRSAADKARAVIEARGIADLSGYSPKVNEDGTVTMYHRTSPEAAAEIKRTGQFSGGKENTGEVFLSSRPDGQAEGYGKGVVEVRVRPEDMRMDDAFKDEIHAAAAPAKVTVAPAPAPHILTQPEGRSVINAYHHLAQKTGFPAVAIAELADQSGIPLDKLKAQLLRSQNNGKVVLSTGDWSLASDKVKSGAIEVPGQRPMLQVRFLQDAGGMAAAKAKREQDRLGFYSHLSRVAEDKLPNRGTPEQILGTLKGAGVKEGELLWTGLPQFMEGKPSVSKEELRQFIAENGVQMKEVVKGAPKRPEPIDPRKLIENDTLTRPDGSVVEIVDGEDEGGSPDGSYAVRYHNDDGNDEFNYHDTHEEAYAELLALAKEDAAKKEEDFDAEGDTKFSQYTLPGGSNYKEKLLTLPVENARTDKHFAASMQAKYGERYYQQMTDAERAEYARLEKGASDKMRANPEFHSTHWDEPNVLLHTREADHTDTEGNKVRLIEEIQSDWHQTGRKEGYGAPKLTVGAPIDDLYPVFKDGEKIGDFPGSSPEQAVERAGQHFRSSVPDAPFKKTWPEVAFKRALRSAVDDGMDKLAWVTGDTWTIQGVKDGAGVMEHEVGDAKLDDTVGKDVAKKMRDGVGIPEGRTIGTLSGLDLKVGGSGMRGFYDKILPDFVRKYVKPWGGKVETTTLPGKWSETEDGSNGHSPDVEVHSVTITPAMRESIHSEGQALFASKANADPVAARKEGVQQGKAAMQAKVEAARGKEREKAQEAKQALRDKAAEKVAELRDKMTAMVSKVTAYQETLRKAEKAGAAGVKRGVAETRAELEQADRWFSADMNRVRDDMVNFVRSSLPPEERGHFISQIASVLTDRPGILRGEHNDATKPFRTAFKLMGKIEAKGEQVHRDEVTDEIRGIVRKALDSPSVDVEYKKKLRALLAHHEFAKLSDAKRRELESRRAYVQRKEAAGEAHGVSDSDLAELRRLDRSHISELTTDSLEALRDKAQNLADQGRLTVALRAGAEARHLQSDMQAMGDDEGTAFEQRPENADLPPLKQGETHSLTAMKRLQNQWIAAQNKLAILGKALMPMDAVMDILGANKGTYKGFLFRKVRGVIDLDYNAKLAEKNDAFAGLDAIIAKHKLTGEDGRRIGVLAAANQEGGRERLVKAGIPEAHLDKIIASLTPGEMEAYRYMRDAMDAKLPELRTLMRELYNEDVIPVEHYFPMIRDWHEYAKTQDLPAPVDPKSGLPIRQDELATWKNVVEDVHPTARTNVEKGMTISRLKGAATPIRIDAFEVWRRHMDDVLHLLHVQRDLKRIGKVMRSDQAAEKYGRAGRQIMVDWLDTIARNGGSEALKHIGWLDWLRQHSSVGMVGYRLVSQLKHISNAALAMHHVGLPWYIKGLSSVPTAEAKSFMRKNMAETFDRHGGEMGMEEIAKFSRIANVGFAGARFFDKYNAQAVALGSYFKTMVAKGYTPAEALQADVRNIRGSEASKLDRDAVTAVQDALVRMRRVVASAAPKDAPQVLSRGTGLGNNVSVSRTVFQFGNIFLDRWSNLRHDFYGAGIKQRNFGQASTVALGLLAAVAAETLITMGVRNSINTLTGNHPPEEDNEFAKDMLVHSAKQFPFVGQIVGAWQHGGSGIPLIDSGAQIVSSAKHAVEAKTPGKQAAGAVRSIGGAAALLGVPGAGQGSDLAAKLLSGKEENDVQRIMREHAIKRAPAKPEGQPTHKELVAQVRAGGKPMDVFKAGVATGMKAEQVRSAVKEGMKTPDVATFEKLPLPAAIEVFRRAQTDPAISVEMRRAMRAILQRKHAGAAQLKAAA